MGLPILYRTTWRSKKTLSVIPAFLFVRKRKSILYFFNLLRHYVRDTLTLHTLWCIYDKDEIFTSQKTLYRYHRDLMRQIDVMITILTSEIVSLSSSYKLPEILPDESAPHRKVEILLLSLDRLTSLLHLKGKINPVLDEEKYAFLHCFLFQKGNIILLDSRNFP